MIARTSLLLAAALAFASPAFAQVWSPDKQAFADDLVRKLSGPKAQRIAYGVSIGGAPVHTQGFSGIRGLPATNSSTHFRIGSLTKQFTAAAMLALIEDEGQARRAPAKFPALAPIGLDTRIDRFLPEAKNWPTSGPVRIRHLLNMQTGFANYTDVPAGIISSPTSPIARTELRAEIDAMIQAQATLPPPGTGYGYSNTNYFLLAEILDKASGKDYRTFMRKRVFERAGMTSSGFVGDPPANLNLATPPAAKIDGAFGKPDWSRGPGDIVSTVDDQLAWHKALMSFKVISPQSGAQMFTGVAPAGNFTPSLPHAYAMGWVSVPFSGQFVYSYHNGSIAGFSSYAAILTDFKNAKWTSVIVFANDDGVNVGGPVACIAAMALDNQAALAGMNASAKSTCGVP